MIRVRHALAAFVAVFALTPQLSMAEETAPQPVLQPVSTQVAVTTPTAEAADSRTLGMVTGSRTGTYYRFGSDIKDMMKSAGIDIDVKESSGSIDNINRISSKENAAFGIVQSDVLGFLMRSKEGESRKLADNLRMVFPFYSEEIHVLASKDISDFKGLNGKAVVVGAKGSGSWLTAVNLFGLAGIEPSKMLRLTPEEGMVAVLSGKADAMIYVGGKPVKLFQNLDSLSGNGAYATMLKNVHLLPLNQPEMLKEYGTATISKNDYTFVKEDVPTLTVTAVLVSYGFGQPDSGYAKQRCDDIRKFSKSLSGEIEGLQRSGHPKWQEVNLDAEIGFWKRDKCSETGGTTSTALENELLDTLRTAH